MRLKHIDFDLPRVSPYPEAHERFSLIIDAVSLLHAPRAVLSSIMQWDAEKKRGIIQRCKDTQKSLCTKHYYQYDQLDNKMLAEGVLIGC